MDTTNITLYEGERSGPVSSRSLFEAENAPTDASGFDEGHNNEPVVEESRVASIVDMPFDIVNEVLQYLPPTDVVAFGMASRRCRENVLDYHAHSLACLLGQFFDNDGEIAEFRRLQVVYGVLISGRCALQFFLNEGPPASPLDVFVENTHTRPVVKFLRGIGFHFVDPTITNPGSGPFTFHKQTRFVCLGRGRQRINLIASRGPPLQVILSFHSTVVMNVITHNRAYSFFPKATFEQKLGMTVPPISGDHDVAREKYRGRGWRITRYTGVHGYKGTQGLDASNPDSDFAPRIRWVGDRKCLSVNLPPVVLDGVTRVVPPIEYNSWRVRAADNHPTLTLHVLHWGPPTRQHGFCCAAPVLFEILYSNPMRWLLGEQRWAWHYVVFCVVAPKVLQGLAMFPDAEASSIIEWFNKPENLMPTLQKLQWLYRRHLRQANVVA